ncbi:DUF2851 family protein [bacterium]|nr:DUF2851 family protein [bacterium]
MSEEFLHYLWQNKLYTIYPLVSIQGEMIEVIHPGDINTDAGPDFFNAKIKIGETLWAGNVEIHSKASDWFVHKHQDDPNYDNVILHVIYHHDKDVVRKNGKVMPALEISCTEDILSRYQQLKSNVHPIACSMQINELSGLHFSLWLERLLVERIEDKVNRIQEVLRQTTSNWDETFYRVLTRNMGFGINSSAMEQLARQTPFSVLLKYSTSIFQVEAVLFGQAGLLSKEGVSDKYYLELQKEYNYLRQKHELKPLESHVWKFLRLRPANFPTIRLSQLAQLVVKIKGLFGQLLEGEDLKDIFRLLTVSASDYWTSHHQFGKDSPELEKKLGGKSQELIVVNTLLPYLFAYGHSFGESHYQQKALAWYEKMKPEKNKIVAMWSDMGVRIENAGDAQAAIFLYNSYCKPKKCLQCRIGHQLLATRSEMV